MAGKRPANKVAQCPTGCNVTLNPDSHWVALARNRCAVARRTFIVYSDELKKKFGGIPLVSRGNDSMPYYKAICTPPSRPPTPPSQISGLCHTLRGSILEEFRYFAAFNPTWCAEFYLTLEATQLTSAAWCQARSFINITKMVRISQPFT